MASVLFFNHAHKCNVNADLSNRGQIENASTHVINVEIKDNHEDALLGGRAILQLAQMVN
jgi:RNA polymerase II subunit A C-terminal domain phosphatase SSU72